jgi:hypothetical protein
VLTLRCTQRVRKRLRLPEQLPEAPASSRALRDWYVHLVRFGRSEFAIATSQRVAEIPADAISKARDACATETFARGKPRKDKRTGEMIPPKEYRRSGATVNRHIATLSHLFSFAVKERRLIDRNPGGDIRRKKEPRGRTRFLSDEERAALWCKSRPGFEASRRHASGVALAAGSPPEAQEPVSARSGRSA